MILIEIKVPLPVTSFAPSFTLGGLLRAVVGRADLEELERRGGRGGFKKNKRREEKKRAEKRRGE